MSDIEFGKEVHYHLSWKKGKDSKTYIKLSEEAHYSVQIQDGGPECSEAGCVEDIVSNWETTEAMALEGKKMQAIDPDNQALVDTWMEQYRDCFGK